MRKSMGRSGLSGGKRMSAPAALRRVLRQNHTPRGILTPRRHAPLAMLPAALLVALALLTAPASAQPGQAERRPLEAPFVDRSHAQQAYRLIERWVAAGTTAEFLPPATQPAAPGDAGGDAPAEAAAALREAPLDPIPVSGLGGVRVTLRMPGGMLVGLGDARRSELDPNEAGTADLAAAAQLATARALQDVRRTIEDLHVRAALRDKPMPTDVAGYNELVRSLLVDLQVAHRLEPIHLPQDADDDAVYYRYAPGFHGLRMEHVDGEGKTHESWVWPASALAANLSPRSQLVQLMSELGYQARDLERLGRPVEDGGLPIERFEVVHLVRPAPRHPVMPLVRGHVILPPHALDAATLDTMIQRLGEHLLARVDDHGRFQGAYLPTSDQYEPVVNETQEAALVAYALARWAQYVADNDPADRRGFEAQAAVRCAVDALTARLDAQVQPPDAPTMALALMALVESPQMADRKLVRDRLGERLLALRDESGLFVAAGRDRELLNVTEQALVIDALAHLYVQTRDEALLAALRRSLAAVWERLGPGQAVSALPWLVDAQVRLDALGEQAPPAQPPPARGEGGAEAEAGPAGGNATYAERIAALLQELRERQVVEAPPPGAGPADVVGGFDLQPTPPDSPPNPDWRSSLVLLAMADALRRPEIVPPQDRLNWLLTTGLAARFLAQLMFDEPGMFYVRGQQESLGAVRRSLWDNQLAATYSAMALLASLELEETLDAIRDEGGLSPRAAREDQ